MKRILTIIAANVVTLLWDLAQTAATVAGVILVAALAARALGLL